MGKSIISIVLRIFIMIAIPAIIGAAEWLYGGTQAKIIRDIILSVIGTGCVVLLIKQEWIADKNLFTVEKKFGNLIVVLLAGVLYAALMPLLPVMGWPYPVLAVIISLHSNSLIGIVCNALFVMLSVALSGADYALFLLYFVCGTVAVILFRKLDEEFKITIPIFVSGMLLLLVTTAEVILFATDRITIEFFIIPFINLFLTTIFYLIFLKYYSVRVVHKYRDKYMKISDTEYPLLVKLKSDTKELYYQTVHCAYLTDKIAIGLRCDKTLAKAGAYYHRINVFCGDSEIKNYQELMREHEFPPALEALLLEYNDKNFREKENVIIYFSDLVVSSITYLLEKDPQREIDYAQIITAIFDKKIKSGILNQSKITMSELNQMKQIFMEEKLYYDFLR